MATRLIGQETGCTKVVLGQVPIVGTPAGTAAKSGGWFFYSNSPEEVAVADTADGGAWLNRVDVNGSGQLYVWHANTTGASVVGHILIYNPNSFPITVSSSNYGLTNGKWNDIGGWFKFWAGTSKTVTVAAGGWGSIFAQTVANGSPWGIVARLSIKDASGRDASATLFDIAYTSPAKSGNASRFAIADPTTSMRRRGYANTGYWNQLNLNTITLSTAPQAFKIAASGDSFQGQDLVYITDPSGQVSGLLEGAYGVQHYLVIPVRNPYTTSKRVRIFAGNHNTTNVMVAMYGYGGAGGCSLNLNPGEYIDILDDTIPAGATVTYSFQYVVPAGSSAAVTLGVRMV